VTSSRFRNSSDEADEAYEAEEETSRTGIVLLVAGSLLAGVLVILAVLYAANFHGWRNVPKAPPDAAAATDAQLAALGRSYLAIANPANQQLNIDVNAYTTNQRSNLAAARADLRAEVATATQFDRQLAAIRFPAAAAAIARDLIAANQARGQVITRQARARTLARMQALNAQHAAADAAVEAQVKRIRQALHLPPAASS
jgi:hypothetical protein